MEDTPDKKFDLNSFKSSLNKLKEDSVREYAKLQPHIQKYGFLLLLIIPLILSIYLRIQSASLPVTDIWARDTILNNLRSEVQSQIDKEYPNLPQVNKEEYIRQRMNSAVSSRKAEFDQAIKQLSYQFKLQMKDDYGATYLIGIDPYYWTRHARNILNNGHPGDELVDGKWYDNHMLAPGGRFVPPDMFHAYFLAYSYKAAHLFDSSITLESITVYNPAVLMALATIIAFLLGRRMGGNITGFFSASIVAIHQSILVRTIGGFSDTDPYQVLFPLLIFWMFLESFNAMVKWESKLKYLLPALTGFLVGFYSFVWGGWWYSLLFMTLAGGIYLLIYYYPAWKEKGIFGAFTGTHFSKVLLTLVVILLAVIPSILFFSGPKALLELHQFVQGFIDIHEVKESNVWPNVYITVAEQNEGSIASAISNIGGIGGRFMFYFSILGLLLPLLFKKLRHDNNIDIKYPILILIWLAVTTWAVTRGIRFTLMMVPPFAIGFGMGITFLGVYTKKLINFLNISNRWYNLASTIIAVLLGLSLLGMIPFQDNGLWPVSYDISRTGVTDMNDGWWNSLEAIKINSSQNAIVTSWWDFGHWFKYIADRPVTFDGTSQNNPQAHWVGKILQTDDERYAVGILRMLDCGANTGFEKIDEHVKDIARTRDIIDPMFTMSRQEAYEYLYPILYKYPLATSKDVNEILNYTHCVPPEAYFIASTDMIGKSGVWGHFGLWDFNRSLMYNELLNEKYREDPELGITFLKERFNLTEEEAQRLYTEIISFDSNTANTWIATWPGYQQVDSGCTPLDSNMSILECSNGLFVNLTEPYTVLFKNNPALVPHSLIYPTSSGIGKIDISPDSDFSILLYQKPDKSIRYLIANKRIADSMFTRMYFMEGFNLQYFEPFSYQHSFNDWNIYVYKVNWNKILEEENNARG